MGLGKQTASLLRVKHDPSDVRDALFYASRAQLPCPSDSNRFTFPAMLSLGRSTHRACRKEMTAALSTQSDTAIAQLIPMW